MTNTKPGEESLYLPLFKNGDPRAFAYFFNLYWEQLYTVAYRHLRDEDLSKDVVQEVFIHIWEKRSLINSAYISLRPYFFRALKNKVLNYYASERVRKDVVENMLHRMETTVFVENTSATVYQKLEEIVEISVAKLPGLMKTVYQMRSDNYSIQQIAEHLNIAEQTVKNYLSEAKKILKKELTQRFADHDGMLVLLISSYCVHNLLT
ncbi:RNA polymerase sigma factor [Sphingobacterium sp. LRF_L2]|uniref:RNA polymerase sigma factor n=1 Tax=Sphingobacterium sp. LRF_L2 TaxID=3369421 RepID=UPI003F626861